MASFVQEWNGGKGFLSLKQKKTSNYKSNVLHYRTQYVTLIVLHFNGRAVGKGRAELDVWPPPRGEFWIIFFYITSGYIKEIKLRAVQLRSEYSQN